jgi:hypothetical protein
VTLPCALLPPLPPDSVSRAYALAAGEVKGKNAVFMSRILRERTMERKIYEQLPEEPSRAFEMFCRYRDAGPSRELRAVYRQATGKPAARQASGTWLKWARQWRWKERALAYDVELEAIRQTAQQTAVAVVAKELAEKREITAQRGLEETANLAFSRVTDVVQWKGIDGLVDSDALPDSVAAAIESIEVVTDKDGKVRHKVKFHHKMPALDKLGQNQKLWGSKDDANTINNNLFQIFLDAAKSGELLESAKLRGIDLTPPKVTLADVTGVGKEG